jgi:hypothetical protein
MSTPSANINETAIAGKYSRVFASNPSGLLYPINCVDWKFPLKTTDIEGITGFEDFGFGNGLTGIIEAKGCSINCPVQVARSGSGLGNALTYLYLNQFFVYECWLINPDLGQSVYTASLLRFTGVAQVTDTPVENEVNGKPMTNIQFSTRGAIYRPGFAAPSPAAMLSLFINTPS